MMNSFTGVADLRYRSSLFRSSRPIWKRRKSLLAAVALFPGARRMQPELFEPLPVCLQSILSPRMHELVQFWSVSNADSSSYTAHCCSEKRNDCHVSSDDVTTSNDLATRVGALARTPAPFLAAFGLIQNRFLVTPQLHRDICGPRTAWLESGLIGSVPDIIWPPKPAL